MLNELYNILSIFLTGGLMLANWVGSMTSICVHAETCGHAGAIEHNGDVFACNGECPKNRACSKTGCTRSCQA